MFDMNTFLQALRQRRAALQDQIDDEHSRPAPESLRLRALKKLRLRLRERIEFLEHRSRHGVVRSIPVVRRRLHRFVTQPTG